MEYFSLTLYTKRRAAKWPTDQIGVQRWLQPGAEVWREEAVRACEAGVVTA